MEVSHNSSNRGWPRGGEADLEVLVRSLLPLPGHGVRRRTGERPHGSEDDEGDADGDGGVHSDLAALVGGGLGAGTVRTEGDPVGWWWRWGLAHLVHMVCLLRGGDASNRVEQVA